MTAVARTVGNAVAGSEAVHTAAAWRDDGYQAVDWYVTRSDGTHAELAVQARREDGSRRCLMVADELPPSLAPIWPATSWPEREALERSGLRFSGQPIPAPMWTRAVRDAFDLADGAEAIDADSLEAQQARPLLDANPFLRHRLDLRVTLEGRQIKTTHAIPGLLHSGFERLASTRHYIQLPVLAEGLNEQAPYALGLAAILAVEACLQVQPTPRCQHLRMLLAEVSRIAAHSAWLAVQAGEDEILRNEALLAREAAAIFLSDATGSRSACGVQRIGGMHGDTTTNSLDLLSGLASAVERAVSMARRRMLDRSSWRRRYDGVGAIDADTARGWALSGPVLRATGITHDVRRIEPYLAYGEMDFDIPGGTSGDIPDRVHVRLQEMQQSLILSRQCVDSLPSGPVERPAPSSPLTTWQMIDHFEQWMEGHGHRALAGTTYLPTESADGELALALTADGTGKPASVHLRSPSLYHCQILEHLLTGSSIATAHATVASLNIIASEMDR